MPSRLSKHFQALAASATRGAGRLAAAAGCLRGAGGKLWRGTLELGARARPLARSTLSASLDLIAPGFCRQCGGEVACGRDPFCAACLRTLPWIARACARCGTPAVNPPRLPERCFACAPHAFHFDLAAAGGGYQGPLRTAILRYKFEGDRAVLPLLREALARAARSEAVAAAVSGAGAIVPVPLHFAKSWWRGRDPAGELAHELARILGAASGGPAVARLLRKVRWTPSQVHLPEGPRRRNLRGAFAAVDGAVVPPAVILVDDVLTTGTTASRCALALKEAGVQTVIVLAAARS
jgi:ComF family protein